MQMNQKILIFITLVQLFYQIQSSSCDVSHCLSCSQPNNCSQCQNNYEIQTNINGTNQCVLYLSQNNQRILSDSSTTVPSNLINYYNNSSGNCTDIVSCSICSNSSYCQLCYLGYFYNNQSKCIKCNVLGCKTCTQQNKCTQCLPNFQLISSKGKCMSCNVINCAFCSLPDYCSTCNLFNNTFTLSQSGNCVFCNKNISSVSNCLICSSNNQCGVCQNGYQLLTYSSNSPLCIKCNILNCKLCDLFDGIIGCFQCMQGYSSTNNHQCALCKFPCLRCNSNSPPNNCLTCFQPFYYFNALDNGICIKRSIKGCMVVDPQNNNLCRQCYSNYLLSSNKTLCNQRCSTNCYYCENSQNCLGCQQGYKIESNGKCVLCAVKGCKLCNQTKDKCQQCFTGFYLIQNQCKSCPSYCKQCSSNSTCSVLLNADSQVLILVNNQFVLAFCQPNCLKCSSIYPSICFECLNGYYLNNGKCKKCLSGCLKCYQLNHDKCISCYANNFMSNESICIKCNSPCRTCLSIDSPQKCTSCKPGFYLNTNNNTCIAGCSKNCLSCSNSNNCLQCQSGFTLYTYNSNKICVPCLSSCRMCVQQQPTKCLECGQGFYLSGVSCLACPTNCPVCNGNGCLKCYQNFYLTSTQTCSKKCVIPCATCLINDQTKCTTCIAGYIYDSITYQCKLNIVCNLNCMVCPLGYALKQGDCLVCQNKNCNSCNVNNLTQCTSCKSGYYLSNKNTCELCDVSCTTCLSDKGCLTCAEKYTKYQDSPLTADGYECTACNSPCLTCINSPNFCTSCMQGYKFMGWKCQKKFYFSFQLTLLISLNAFNTNYYLLLKTLSQKTGNLNDINSVILTKASQGSVIAQGAVAPAGESGSTQAYDQYAALNNSLESNEIAGMQIGASSISIEGGSATNNNTNDNNSQTPTQSNNLGIILGISISAGVITIAIVVIIVYVRLKKRNKEQQNQNDIKTRQIESGKNFSYEDDISQFDTKQDRMVPIALQHF